MIWADRIAEKLKNTRQHVDDMKTPSGFIHMGSLRGPILHDVMHKTLTKHGVKSKFTYIFNDFDPVDGLSSDLEKDFTKYLGFPLRMAPSPDGKARSFADFFADNFKIVLKELGCEPEYLSSWDMYREGKFNGVIKDALDHAEKIQEIYARVSGSKKKEQGWYPLQVICPNCQKLGTTKVTAWNGQEVEYTCEINLVTWATGCGHKGKMSPYDGTAKLPWKIDWPAHWKVLGVTFEGAGKDHASRGGSYDIAFALCAEVFHYPKPYYFPYEHFLVGGRKMSSSKGIGFKAHDLINILPPELGRFVMVRTLPNRAIEFDPYEGMTVPSLFDEFDRCAHAFWANSDPDLARIFELSQVNNWYQNTQFLPRFIDIAKNTNLTRQELIAKFSEVKSSSLTANEIKILESRIKYAAIWIDKFAPQEYHDQQTPQLSKKMVSLTSEQKAYLKEVITLLNAYSDPDKLQLALYEKTKDMKISPKLAFSALYKAIIGKDFGPKAGSFLLQFPKEGLIKRLNEVIK